MGKLNLDVWSALTKSHTSHPEVSVDHPDLWKKDLKRWVLFRWE